MTTCEYCGRALRQGDTIHAIKYGTLTVTGFKASQASAVVVLCDSCGNNVSNIVYSYLDHGKLAYPVIFIMYNELTSCQPPPLLSTPVANVIIQFSDQRDFQLAICDLLRTTSLSV
jgi:hypothetical protein